MSEEVLKNLKRVWLETQTVKLNEVKISKKEFLELKNSWKDDKIPHLQKKVVEIEIEAFKEGKYIFPIYSSFAKIINAIEMETFTFLDAACGTAHYYEALKCLVSKKVDYYGSDYSEPMIFLDKEKYPEVEFFVQDLCSVKEGAKCFDVVMLSGVIEHVAEWEKVVENSMKLAKKYIIIHRGQFSLEETVYVKGGQYNIITPKAYISKSDFFNCINSMGLSVVGEFEYNLGNRIVTASVNGKPSFKVDRISLLLKKG